MPPTRVRPPLHRDAADDAGFTVLEALVSFVILTLVSTAGVSAIVNATAASGRSANQAAAGNLAQQDLQAARSVRFPSYPTAKSYSVTVAPTTYTVTRTITNACPVDGNGNAAPAYDTNTSMRVTATVGWAPYGTRNSVVMTTEIAC